jgi:hypothetical protein
MSTSELRRGVVGACAQIAAYTQALMTAAPRIRVATFCTDGSRASRSR